MAVGGQLVCGSWTLVAESSLHAHVLEERAELFHSVNGGSAEAEVLEFLRALVYLSKPNLLLETGTGAGLGTLAIARGMELNGFGELHTVDIDDGCTSQAQSLLASQEVRQPVHYHTQQSMHFIENWEGDAYDFVFFDSLISFRHTEFKALQSRGKLSPGAVCVFHDTSRLRGATMHDYNPEMIAALDEESEGRQWLEFGLSRGLRVLKLG